MTTAVMAPPRASVPGSSPATRSASDRRHDQEGEADQEAGRARRRRVHAAEQRGRGEAPEIARQRPAERDHHDRGGDADGRVDAEDLFALEVGDEREGEERDQHRELPLRPAGALGGLEGQGARAGRDMRSVKRGTTKPTLRSAGFQSRDGDHNSFTFAARQPASLWSEGPTTGRKECAYCASERSARSASRRVPRRSRWVSRGPDKTADIKASIDISKPKNIILFVGDGMGDAGGHARPLLRQGRRRAPEHGRAARSAATSRPTTSAPAAAPPYPPNYVPDSAPTATRLVERASRPSTGASARARARGVTVPGTNFKTYMEIARDRGLATGNVSTAEITDATPAGPSSHISQRGCQGPNDTRTDVPDRRPRRPAGSARSPSSRPTRSFDVVLGGGRARYAAAAGRRRHRAT